MSLNFIAIILDGQFAGTYEVNEKLCKEQNGVYHQ